MGFKTELHCHSGIVSACGHLSPKRIVERYLESGYTSLVITDHINPATFKENNYQGDPDWDAKMDFFLHSYHALREEAQGRLHILLGAEVYHKTDYLLYGVTEQFLRANPEIHNRTIAEISEATHAAGLLLVQAHPFRNHMVVTPPELLDGMEVYNGTHTHSPFRNEIAEQWADHYGMIKTSGSDMHSEKMFITGGIETNAPITSNAELIATLKSGNYRLLRDDSIFADSLNK